MARFGEEPVLQQKSALLAYREGRYDRALELANALFQPGSRPRRVAALPLLIALAREDLETARRELRRYRHISVLGERSALEALVAAASDDRDGAASAWTAAVERNALFADPGVAAAVLAWDPVLVETLEGAISAEVDDSAQAQTTPPVASESETDSREGESRGCCGVAPVRRLPGTSAALVALFALVAARSRRRLALCQARPATPGSRSD